MRRAEEKQMRVCIDEAWDKDATLEIEDSSSVSCWIDCIASVGPMKFFITFWDHAFSDFSCFSTSITGRKDATVHKNLTGCRCNHFA